ncbi:MAG: DUF4040 domain-containing protein [Oscillospiraceae bacterium]|nr:DUF4040 domain-containing protein [Oscillospiraceae bacterium]
MIALEMILLAFLIACAIMATVQKNLLTTVLIFMSYSVVMSIIWVLLESPDLAGTEAAVGAGVTTILFFITLKKVGELHFKKSEKKKQKDQEEKGEDDA